MKPYVTKLLLLISIFGLFKSEIVEIDDGLIQGTTMQSRKGANIHAFLKIPFAKPPIGDLRFQAPIRNDKWQGTLNATTYGPACVQYITIGNLSQSEDCLHLYVYTRDLKPATLKPVIIFIHGGAFEIGSGMNEKPNYLLDREIVLVTINYRLGALGFLATGTKEAVGNMGLKDQALAIQWVNRNIEKFGGDPKKVTLAGLSAGAHSATAHLVSNMSKDLINGVIALSGAITWQKGLRASHLDKARELAEKLNCPTNITELVGCLKEKNASEIAAAAKYQWHNCPIMPFIPVLEPDFGQERFFMGEPNELFKMGNFSKIPILIGMTADEFISPAKGIISNETSLSELNGNFSDFTSKCFFYDSNGIQTRKQIAKSLRKLYFPFEKIDARSFNNLNHLCADGVIGYGVHRLVHYASNFTDVFYYKFSYIGRFSGFNYPHDKPYGVHHGDDMQYTIFGENGGRLISESDPENFMVERMTRIWEQFALKGDPNNESDEYLSEMNWPKHTNENEYYLDIGLHLVEKQGLYLERFAVWDSFENEISASAVTRITFFAISIAFISHLTL